MTSASHPRFRLLIGWSCLMSSALLIIIIYLGLQPQMGVKQNSNDKAISGKHDHQIGHHPGPSFNDYIRLIRDPEEIWICHPCKNSSFTQKNSTVNITVSGLYSFHAQVTFISSNKLENSGSIILHKNKVPGTQYRMLSKVKHFGLGTATMICLVELKEGDSISLEVDPINNISGQDSDTYWEIMFLNNK